MTQRLIMGDNWNDRIKNTEVNPPANGWNKIAASLDDSLNGLKFPVALYNLEKTPPADAWDKIEAALDEEKTPVVPLKRHFAIPVFLKYVIAAGLIGVIAFAAIKFFNNDTTIKADTALESNNRKSADTIKKTDQTQTATAKAQPVQTEPDSDEQALEESKHTYARLDMLPVNHRYSSKIKRSLYKFPAQLASSYSESSFVKMPELQYPHRAAVNDSPDAEADRYLMFKNSDGQFIRISKKLSNLFCCVSGEEQDNNCTDQLKKWREKLAASSFVPSPDNFMDILDLVNSLEDNRN
jgi:hypothetical protein